MASIWTLTRPPELTRLLEMINAGCAHIKHVLSFWRYDSVAHVAHFESCDELGEVWAWACSLNDEHGHLRWKIVQCVVGRHQPTVLEARLPDWSVLGELLEEATLWILKIHKHDKEALAAAARYRASMRVKPAPAPAYSPAPAQLALF